MFRKNQSPSGGRRGFGGSGQRDQKKSQEQAPKHVSPNYQVNMMHHNASTQRPQQPSYPSDSAPGGFATKARGGGFGKPRGGGYGKPRDGGGQDFGPPKPRVNFDRPPSAPHARKGHFNINVEVKDELYHSFNEKLKADGKSSKEVLSQLISFYIMGKINV